MQNKFLYSGIILAFVVGLSLSSANAISPFTEIGNLEMEVLDALNDVIISLNAEIVRIDSINATQLSEVIEQDTIQADLDIAEATLAALPIIVLKTLNDTNNSDCELSPFTNVTGWCPPVVNQRPYNITDSNVLETSFVNVAIDANHEEVDNGQCNVVEIAEGSFLVDCLGSIARDESKLHYIIVN